MEVAKTRLQLDGELRSKGTPKTYTNTLDVLRKTAKSEGLRACQKGLGAAVSYILPVLSHNIFCSYHFYLYSFKNPLFETNFSFTPDRGFFGPVYIPIRFERISLR